MHPNATQSHKNAEHGSRIQRVNWVGGAQEPLAAEKYVVAYVFLTIPGPEAVNTLPS